MGSSRLIHTIIGLLMCFTLNVALAQDALPITESAVKAFQEGNIDQAKDRIHFALANEAEKNHPYTWCVKGFVYKELYKNTAQKDRRSPNREIAIEAIMKSMVLDTKKAYFDLNDKALRFLATSIYNDVVLSTRSLNEYTLEEPEQFYDRYKEIMLFLEPNTTFNQQDLELYRVLAEAHHRIYLKDPEKNNIYFDRCADYYNQALSINAQDTLSNYNLAILYYNKGVYKIKKIDHSTEIFELIMIQDECVELFKKSLPFMLKAHELDPFRMEPLKGLRAIYKSLSDDDNEERYKKLLEQYIQEGIIKTEDGR
ncbi:MAG: hypothetical protein NWS86_01730 [Flavobacteriales bacterium]|nr:hypothetical protein [Flavobacteriales bacterium]